MFSNNYLLRKMILLKTFSSIWLVRKIHDGNGGGRDFTVFGSYGKSITMTKIVGAWNF
jgi:hypothetical protein